MNKLVFIAVSKLSRYRCFLLSISLVLALLVGFCWAYKLLGRWELENFQNNQLGIRVENVEHKSGYSSSWLYSFGDRNPASEWVVYIDVACLDDNREAYAVQVYLKNDWIFPRVEQVDLMDSGGRIYSSLPSNPSRLALPYRGLMSVYIVDATNVSDSDFWLEFFYLARPVFSESRTPRHSVERRYSVHVDSETRNALRARRKNQCE